METFMLLARETAVVILWSVGIHGYATVTPSNQSAAVGDEVQFVCHPTDDKGIVWNFKSNDPSEFEHDLTFEERLRHGYEDKYRVSVAAGDDDKVNRRQSTLTVYDVQLVDSGRYGCVGGDGFDSVTGYGYLTVIEQSRQRLYVEMRKTSTGVTDKTEPGSTTPKSGYATTSISQDVIIIIIVVIIAVFVVIATVTVISFVYTRQRKTKHATKQGVEDEHLNPD